MMSFMKVSILGILFIAAVLAMGYGGREIKKGHDAGGTGGIGQGILGLAACFFALFLIFVFAMVAVRC